MLHLLASFLQYDTSSSSFGSNSRLRWTIAPGNDFFVIWNKNWQKITPSPHLSLIPESDLVAVKLRWTFRY